MKFELTCSGARATIDVIVFELESTDELGEALRDALGLEPSRLVVDFRPSEDMPTPAFSIPDAFRTVVATADGVGSNATLRCIFASADVVDAIRQYVPGEETPDRVARIGRMRVVVRVGDIVRVPADAIVNASNTRLVLGGGVSYSIRRASRYPERLQAAMTALAPIEPGGIVVTPSFGITTAPLILHAATASGRPDVIRAALTGCLRAAVEHQLGVIAVPALGTGTGGLASEACARIFDEVLRAHPTQAECPRALVVVLHGNAGAATAFATALGAE